MRSTWKGLWLTTDLKNYNIIKNHKIITMSRTSTIIPYFNGKLIYVYNGHKFIGVPIVKQSFGRKLGEYSITKKPAIFKKKK